MSEQKHDEAHPVLVMAVVLASLAGIAALTLLVSALCSATASVLADQSKAYTEQVEQTYNASHVDIQYDLTNGNADVRIKMVIKDKTYHCIAPGKLDLRLGEPLECAPYRIFSDSVQIDA